MDDEGPILVRKCDRRISAHVIATIKNHPPKLQGLVITGTSGIGKSVLTNWLILMILNDLPGKNIYLYDACKERRSLIQSDRKCYKLGESQYRNGVEKDKESVVLIDTGCGGVVKDISYAGFVVVTSSTNAIPSHMSSPRFEQRYLSVWSWEEVLAGYKIWFSNSQQNGNGQNSLAAALQKLKENYELIGGIVARLFCTEKTTESYIKTVSSAIVDAAECFRPNLSFAKNHHKVMHIWASEDFNEFKYDFAAPRVLTELAGQHVLFRDEKMDSMLESLANVSVNEGAHRTFVGALFEFRVHLYLPDSLHTRKKYIKWVDQQPDKFVLPNFEKLDKNHAFHNIQECMDIKERKDKVYYYPLSTNQKLVDSWMCVKNSFFLFQITIAENKRIVIKEAIEFFAKIFEEDTIHEILFLYLLPEKNKKFSQPLHDMRFLGCGTHKNSSVKKWKVVTHEITNEGRQTVEYVASRKEEGKRSKKEAKKNSRTSKSASVVKWQVKELKSNDSSSSGTQ